MTPDSIKMASSSGPSRRREAAAFAVIFLVTTFALLAATHYATATRASAWYLFQVARHTSWLLGRVGASSSIENPQAYRGREFEIRGAPDDGGRRVEAGAQDKPALSPWEVWRYRSGKLRHDVAACRDSLANLTPPTPLEIVSRSQHIDCVRSRLAQFKPFVPAPGAQAPAAPAVPGLDGFVREALARLDALARSPEPDAVVGPQLIEVQNQTETWRLQQQAFLQKRLADLRERFYSDGPLVRFVLREANPNPQAGGPGLRFSFEVVSACGGLQLMAIFVSAICAFPASWRARLLGTLLGLPILYVVNVARLACLAVIGAWDNGGEWFTFCHEYVWEGVYVIAVVATWLLWLELVAKRWFPRRTRAGKRETA